MKDGQEPCKLRVVTYDPITWKAEVKEVRHGKVTDLLGMAIVFVDRFCADLKACDFCSALAARMLARTDAVKIARELGALGSAA